MSTSHKDPIECDKYIVRAVMDDIILPEYEIETKIWVVIEHPFRDERRPSLSRKTAPFQEDLHNDSSGVCMKDI